jgi:hypothetical protein
LKKTKEKVVAETEEVLVSGRDNHDHAPEGVNVVGPWSRDFGNVEENDILNFPQVAKDNYAHLSDFLARCNFPNDEVRAAYNELTYRCRKLGMWDQLNFLLECAASGLSVKAFGKTLQLQQGTGMIAPAVIREQIGMKQVKEERVEGNKRQSDFKPDENAKEPANR